MSFRELIPIYDHIDIIYSAVGIYDHIDIIYSAVNVFISNSRGIIVVYSYSCDCVFIYQMFNQLLRQFVKLIYHILISLLL